MINKKVGLLCLSLMAMGLASCGGGGQSGTSNSTGGSTEGSASGGEVQKFDLTNGGDITYWCTGGDKDFVEARVAEFKAAHPEFKGKITLASTIDEDKVATELGKDLEAAADVFEIVDNDLPGCVAGRQVLEFDAADKAEMVTVYGADTVAKTAVLGKTYGVPYRNDNSYVLTYDKEIVSDEQAKTVEGILEACKAKGATFNYGVSNSWYTFAPVWGAGGKNYTDDNGGYHSEIATDAVAQAVADFNNLLLKYKDNFLDSDSNEKFNDSTKPCGAVISWNGEANIVSKIGEERTRCAVLPSFTSQGKEIKLSAFHGYKTWCIKKTIAAASKITARAFTLFMGSDAVAEKRVTELKHGVPNVTVIGKTSIWTSKWVNAVKDMIQAGRTVSQLSAGVGSFWSPAGKVGSAIKAGTLTTKELALAALKTCQNGQVNG